MHQSTASEGDNTSTDSTFKDYSKMKVSVRMKNASSDMPHFTNLETAGLRRSPRLAKREPAKDGDNLLCSLHTNAITTSEVKKHLSTFQQRVLHARDVANTLLD